MNQSTKPNLKKSTLKDSSQQLLLYLNTCSINDKDLFLKKQHADIFLIIKSTNKMYPLISKCVIHNCGFFRAKRGQKCVFFEEDFKEEDITNILSLMYGYSLIFDRSKVKDYFGILYKLQFDYMIKVLKNDIFSSFQAYDIFILLEIANSYQFYDIMDCCKSQLLRQNFQQFRYNIYDLLHCSQQVFTLIINFHNHAQRQKRVKGLPHKQIVGIVQQFCNQNSGSTKSLMLLAELTGSKKLAQNMISSKIYNNNSISNPKTIISLIQQQKISETQSIINHKPQTFYSQIIANIQKSVNKTPKKYKEKVDYKTIFEEKNNYIHNSKSPILKNRNSQMSDCDSMMKTRLPTQSVILTQKKNLSKQKGAYKPWQAKKNQQKIVSTPMINNNQITLSKHVSEQNTVPRAPSLIQKKQIQSISFIEQTNKIRPNYFKKQQTQNKINNFIQTEQINNRKTNMVRDKFSENPISPIFQSCSGAKTAAKEFLFAPNSIKQVSEMEDSSYIEHTQLFKRIQMEPPRQPKSTKKIPKLNQKTSIQFLVSKSARKNSFETHQLRFQKEYIPPHKKSPILKQMEDLNKQCQMIQQQNILLMEQVKIIKSNFARKEIQRKQYKQNLIEMDKMLQKLEKQFEAQNQQLIKISAKIQQNRDRDSNSGLLFSSVCSSISGQFF